MTTGNAPRKGRGRPPRIDQQQIIAAARAMPPGELTMQPVADALGVDRTTLHYYVGDRDGLLELVVADLFETELRSIRLPEGASWQEILRAYGSAIRQGVLKLGVTATSFRLSGTGGAASLALAEQVLRALTTAGFGTDDAGRALTLVSGLAMSAAHDVLGSAGSRLRHQTPEVVRALKDLPSSDFPLLSEVVAERGAATTATGDFDFNLDIVIAGLERYQAE
ncbi:TetR/AcrR family transcriptional regulator [Mycolicibacterium fortuitum]|uniref:TetR/AcrR family transcriptional regulator n=1 Tax=Mycolicibacterium fortuitum TaxID=1766 RepID=UPI00096D2A16|nr:TetR/AcrR family transcriptional regulator C-terminal domain-containing protein [Mycolicibacterium fortuitum]OMC12932.1 TetR family transcriptional regulator [Mycolicibacterium fortuitum]